MNLQWYFENANGELSEEIAQKIYEVFIDGFNFIEGSWGVKGIQKAYRNSSILGLLQDKKGDIFGYTFYVVPSEPFKGKFLLWNNATCLKRVCQGKGFYSTKIFKEIAEFFPEKDFGWTGGRSQNLKIFLRYRRIGKCYPFDELYETSEEGKKLMTYLRNHIDEAKGVANLDLSTGVAFNVYKEGELGDYRLNLNLPGVNELETKLENWGMNRSNGDTLLIVSKIEEKLPLRILPGLFNVYSISPKAKIDTEWLNQSFFSISKTENEITFISTSGEPLDCIKKNEGLKVLKVDGDVSSISGVLSSILEPLGKAGITVYAFSTFETDYVFVKETKLEKSIEVLKYNFHINE